jgi:hypothetical protein
MMTETYLADALSAAERWHKASGLPDVNWARDYAKYLLPIITDCVEQRDEMRDKAGWYER